MADSVTLNKSRISKIRFRPIRKAEPEWLYNMRKAGWEHYHNSPLPLRSDHLWRYTDPNLFVVENPERFVNSRDNGSKHKPHGESLISDNGAELDAKGVIFESLDSAVSKHGDLLQEYFGKAIGVDFGKFEALNMATWDRGLFLFIPKNTVIDDTIHFRYIPQGEFGARRLIVIVEENSEATIVDEYSANDKFAGLTTNGSSEIFVGRNSRVKYLNFNRLEENHTLYLTNRAVIDSDVGFESFYAGFGGQHTKVNMGTVLKGKGANSRMTGFIYSDGERKTDCHTRHHHKSGDTYSDLDFKAVLKDKAKSAYTGLIRIEKDAANCEAYQENRNLLLNDGANAESIPELEILTDQVRCSHGATVGPIDPEMVFFLRSRGLSKSRAVRLIIEGFFESTLAKSPDIFREILKEELTKKLGDI